MCRRALGAGIDEGRHDGQKPQLLRRLACRFWARFPGSLSVLCVEVSRAGQHTFATRPQFSSGSTSSPTVWGLRDERRCLNSGSVPEGERGGGFQTRVPAARGGGAREPPRFSEAQHRVAKFNCEMKTSGALGCINRELTHAKSKAPKGQNLSHNILSPFRPACHNQEAQRLLWRALLP